jgi:hypothetical protein
MQSGKTDSFQDEEFVSCMFEIMLIIGIVYDTLKVTFIIPDP